MTVNRLHPRPGDFFILYIRHEFQIIVLSEKLKTKYWFWDKKYLSLIWYIIRFKKSDTHECFVELKSTFQNILKRASIISKMRHSLIVITRSYSTKCLGASNRTVVWTFKKKIKKSPQSLHPNNLIFWKITFLGMKTCNLSKK